MKIYRKIAFWGTFFGCTLLSFSFINPLKNQSGNTCLSLDIRTGTICGQKVPKQLTEAAWGSAGAVGYQAAAQWMVQQNGNAQPLDELQKQYLRPHFGDLVDRVFVVYEAILLDAWLAASFRIKLGQSNAQVYGDRIYLKNTYQPGNLNQVILLAHELYHVKQYEELGSLGNFGYLYFTEYHRAHHQYRDNKLEKEAFEFEAKFARWLAAETKRNPPIKLENSP